MRFNTGLKPYTLALLRYDGGRLSGWRRVSAHACGFTSTPDFSFSSSFLSPNLLRRQHMTTTTIKTRIMQLNAMTTTNNKLLLSSSYSSLIFNVDLSFGGSDGTSATVAFVCAVFGVDVVVVVGVVVVVAIVVVVVVVVVGIVVVVVVVGIVVVVFVVVVCIVVVVVVVGIVVVVVVVVCGIVVCASNGFQGLVPANFNRRQVDLPQSL